MRKIILIISVLFYSLSVSSQKYEIDDLYGAWSDTSSTSGGGGFIFQSDSSWFLIMNGNITGGKNWKDGEKRFSNFYTSDFNSIPMSIDLIIKDLEKGNIKTLPGIFEFLEKEVIKIRIGFDGIRPRDFNKEKNETIILIRSKNKY